MKKVESLESLSLGDGRNEKCLLSYIYLSEEALISAHNTIDSADTPTQNTPHGADLTVLSPFYSSTVNSKKLHSCRKQHGNVQIATSCEVFYGTQNTTGRGSPALRIVCSLWTIVFQRVSVAPIEGIFVLSLEHKQVSSSHPNSAVCTR